MFKRLFDFSLAVLLLALALPLLGIAAILLKFDSPGPALFVQWRMGRGFRAFRLLKLRTMAVEQQGSCITLGEDPRITRMGRWLRKSKIDELPQLWNILRGEMSFVGPRPVIVSLAEDFRSDYQQLLRVRPGLTDPATLSYANEVDLLAQAENPMEFFRTVVTPHKIQLSLAYIEHATLLRDLGLIGQTGATILSSSAQAFARVSLRWASTVPEQLVSWWEQAVYSRARLRISMLSRLIF